MDEREMEIIRHTSMNFLEIFLVDMHSRAPHGHGDLELGILLEGEATLYTGKESFCLKPGDIYIINRYQVHSFQSGEKENLILAFQLSPDFYRKLNYELNFLQFDNNVISSGGLHRSLYGLLMDCAKTYFEGKEYRELRCAGLLFDALYLLAGSPYCNQMTEKEYEGTQKQSGRINRIVEYMSEHYMEKISLEDIGRLEGISPYHASHFIRQALGISFQECLSNMRFEHALRLMEQTSLTLLDICLETGFSSSRYLNQMFQKRFGCSAKGYQRLPVKPEYRENALPMENIQNRYSFTASAFVFGKKEKILRKNNDGWETPQDCHF